MNEFEKKIINKLLMRGFPNDKLLNNRGLIGATIDEVILEVVKNIGVTRCYVGEAKPLVCNKKCGKTEPYNDICLNCGSSINHNAN